MQFFNMLVKSTLETEKFKQIGRLPKFFLETEKKEIPKHGINVWPGYLTTTRLCHDGFYLNIDTCTTFVTMGSIQEEIKTLIDSGKSKQ